MQHEYCGVISHLLTNVGVNHVLCKAESPSKQDVSDDWGEEVELEVLEGRARKGWKHIILGV